MAVNKGILDYTKYSTFNDEGNIIEVFKRLFPIAIKFCPDNNKINFTRFVNSILNEKRWNNWTNNCSDTNNPPDFFNDSEKLMMEVMRIDHYMYVDEKGKKFNPNAKNIGKVVKSLIDNGKMDILNKYIITGAVPLDYCNNYTYSQYVDSFRRVVNYHVSRIPKYRKNRPNYKLYFLIFDESATYFVGHGEQDSYNGHMRPGALNLEDLHVPCLDEAFYSVIRGIDVDQIIWVAPFKYIYTNKGIMEGCQIMIVDPHKPIETFRYDPQWIVCSESSDGTPFHFGTFEYEGMRVHTMARTQVKSLKNIKEEMKRDFSDL